MTEENKTSQDILDKRKELDQKGRDAVAEKAKEDAEKRKED